MSEITTEDDREEVEALLKTIEAEGWIVADYDADVDPRMAENEVTIRVINV